MKIKSNLFRAGTLCALALVMLGLSLAPVTAADSTLSDANWSSMGGVPGATGPVRAAVVDGTGNLYIGGDFTLAGDVIVTNGIAKWNGTNWSALGSGVMRDVLALAVSGSDLYVGGGFTTAGGVPANNIAKWNGSSWSALGSGMGSTDGVNSTTVYALAVSGSDLYAAGHFTTAGGKQARYIAKWDGINWSALGSGIGGEEPVSALAVSGNDVYAGGNFRTAGGIAANGIAKWNGTNWSALGSGVMGDVRALAVSGSDLYVGGNFTTAGGVPANNIAKWDGSNWSALGSGIDGSPPLQTGYLLVSALAVSGGDIYVVGAFETAGGSTANNIAKWNGSSWSTLGSGVKDRGGVGTWEPVVFALAVSGTDLYAGGWFTTAGETTANHIAKWDGNRWTALGSGSGMNGGVSALAVSGNDLYVGGGFTTAGNAAANSIAKRNGTNWSALGSGIITGGPYRVAALAASSSNLYAGGWFYSAGGIAAAFLAQWDGSSWSPLGSGIGGVVEALQVSGSDLYAGGFFTTAGGIAANHVAKWDGSNWSALGSGVGGAGSWVDALAVSGSDLYAGGTFTRAGGMAVTNIAKWNGTNWSALGSGVMGDVLALAVSGSDLYVGGSFTRAGGIAVTNIAKWDGSNWSALGSGMDSEVYALAVSGSDLYVGGRFTTAGKAAANYIAKWDGSSWSTLGSGLSSPPEIWVSVSALAVSGSDLYVGGAFTTAGGKVSANIARAYLLDLPTLSVRRSGSDVEVSWPSADAAGFVLEQINTLTRSAGWIPNTSGVTDDGTHRSATLRGMNSAQFFRLRKP